MTAKPLMRSRSLLGNAAQTLGRHITLEDFALSEEAHGAKLTQARSLNDVAFARDVARFIQSLRKSKIGGEQAMGGARRTRSQLRR